MSSLGNRDDRARHSVSSQVRKKYRQVTLRGKRNDSPIDAAHAPSLLPKKTDRLDRDINVTQNRRWIYQKRIDDLGAAVN